MSTAASVSSVGTSPAHAITTSGSSSWSLLAQSQIPTPFVHVPDRGVHVEELRRGLLAGHDHVDEVAAPQALVGDRQQRVGVRRQPDAHDVGLLVDHMVDEAGVLVAEPVVVLAPDVRGQEVVQRRDRRAPAELARGLQPLRVLVEHRVDDVDERLVAGEQPVAAGQQVALEPALARVLGEDLHHPPVGREILVVGQLAPQPRLAGRLVHRLQAVGRVLVRREQAEVALREVAPHDAR